MIIKRIMTHNPICADAVMPVYEARTLMERKNVSHLPVLDKKGLLVGIVTRRDLVKAGPSPATTLDVYEISYLLSKLKVESVMEKHVRTIDENNCVEEAARIMVEKNINCLPVMRENLLVGIITGTDLLRVLMSAFGAHRPGVRISLDIDEKPGQLAILAGGIAEKGGNIQSFITSESDDPSRTRATCKLFNISAADVQDVLSGIKGFHIEDIR